MSVNTAEASKSKPITIYFAVPSVRVAAATLRKVDKESEAYKEIKESIKVRGQETPIITRALIEGGRAKHPEVFVGGPETGALEGALISLSPTELVNGGHRLCSFQDIATEVAEGKVDPDDLKMTSYEYIRAEYVGVLSEADMLTTQISTNLTQALTRPVEVAKQIARITALDPSLTQGKIAEMLGMHPSRLGRLLKMNKFPEELQKSITAGEISAANAMRLTELEPAKAHELMHEIAGASVDEANKIIDNAKKLEKAKKNNGGKEVFVAPAPHLRKQAEVVARLETPGELDEDTLKWVLSLDDDSVAEARVNWEKQVIKRVENSQLSNFRRNAVGTGILTEDQVKGKTLAQFLELCRASGSENGNVLAESAEKLVKAEINKILAESAA